MALDPQIRDWIIQQAAKLNSQEDVYQGSPRETKILAVWKRERPKMFEELGSLAPTLAFVLDLKRYEAVKQYEKAGWPPTDAEEQATREWCLLEPENPTSPFQPLFDQTSISTIPND